MKNKILNYVLIIFALFLYIIPAMAQPGNPPLDDDPVDPVPIDDWKLILVFAGIIIVACSVFKRQRKAMP